MKKGMYGKGYREKYFDETKKNFKKANDIFSGLIDDISAKIKSGKGEFDF